MNHIYLQTETQTQKKQEYMLIKIAGSQESNYNWDQAMVVEFTSLLKMKFKNKFILEWQFKLL